MPSPYNGELFGWSLTAGDFDGSGYDELVVGVRQHLPGANNAGAVHVISGSSAGLVGPGSLMITQESPGILGSSVAGDWFGRSLAVGQMGRTGHTDLVIGTPWKSNLAYLDGVAHVVYGSSSGLVISEAQMWTQDSGGIPDAAESEDLFGFMVEVDDFDGSGSADLMVGSPGEAWLGSGSAAASSSKGTITVIKGTARGGLSSTGGQLWCQDTFGIPDDSEQGDDFGFSGA